jgi:predicted ester cyclase
MHAKFQPVGNRPIYLRFVSEVLNGGRLDEAHQYLSPDVFSHNGLPGQQPGLAGFIATLRKLRAAFPDLYANATHVISEGDQVVGRFEVRGTHRGEFMGIPATGREVLYEEIVIVRLAGGKIVEHWSVADGLSLMKQIGASDKG